jgi:hypothetical protein
MKVPSSVSKVLTNKYVLYFVLFLAITNVFGYIIMGQITAALFFIIVAYLITNFSKNMIIVLGAALLVTNILMVGNHVKEGMTSKNEKKPQVETKASGSASGSSDKDENIIMPPHDHAETHMNTSTAAATHHSQSLAKDEEETEVKPTTTDEAMNVMSNKRRNRIDYASTIEDAYGDLNNILGSDGIKRLTDDTQRLMSQQLQLADAMKSMTPLLENAKSMLQGFDLKGMNGLADLAKNFSPSK